MVSSTENVKLGVCTVLFDNQDMGFTKGGVEVDVTTDTHEVTVDQFGDTPIDELITGRKVTAKVPLAETTLENLVKIMPGSEMVTEGGAKAEADVTFTDAPANGDWVKIGNETFTFKTSPTGATNEIAVADAGTVGAAAAALVAAIEAHYPTNTLVTASAALGVVTVVARHAGLEGNAISLSKQGTNITVESATLTGGLAATKKKVAVKTGVSTSLLTIAKKLVLRPKGTNGELDFTIHKAMTAGSLSFAYMVDQERVFNTTFKGYADVEGDLFSIGDDSAAA